MPTLLRARSTVPARDVPPVALLLAGMGQPGMWPPLEATACAHGADLGLLVCPPQARHPSCLCSPCVAAGRKLLVASSLRLRWGRGGNDPPCSFLRHSLIILLTRFRHKQVSAEKTALCYLITHREQRFAYSKRNRKKSRGKCLPLNITEAFDGNNSPWPISLSGVLPEYLGRVGLAVLSS